MHIPVMLNEVIDNLNIKSDGTYIDVTFGCGGHTKKILNYLGKNGRIYVFDKDYGSILIAKELSMNDSRIHYFHKSFRCVFDVLKNCNLLGKIDGIVADLGLSTLQLSDFSRGFSFSKNGFLDMRMNVEQELNAFNWINSASFPEIIDVLFHYGEEIFAKRIARNIVTYRKDRIIKTTYELSNIVCKSYPYFSKRKHPATKTFQAIRIFINKEFDDLNVFLNDSINILSLNGRFVIISFHSLEDKIVKNFIFNLRDKILKNNICIKPLFNYLKPSISEINNNISSRSAIMRCLERVS